MNNNTSSNMDLNTNDRNEPSVDEGAFWHANMDLYYGYLAGEVVEVEHEPNKYWLALIQYCFKHLVLLKWIGDYGCEFWVDTSMTNTATSSSGTLSEFNSPKRLFPLGYHLQTQLKSQFLLEKPSKILLKPSLYNPCNDPYANIKTIDDLLVHEIKDQDEADAFALKSANDTASIALAKCKTKIDYGQEDQDELEAALQSLTGLESSDFKEQSETSKEDKIAKPNELTISKVPEGNLDSDTNGRDLSEIIVRENDSHQTSPKVNQAPSQSKDEISQQAEDGDKTNTKANKTPKSQVKYVKLKGSVIAEEEANQTIDTDILKMCKRLQAGAIKNGRYCGVKSDGMRQSDQIFFSKPKQFFDVGGANHERLFVPGTLLEVCHFADNASGNLDIFQWFAFVVRNVGGRLTLRWFLCNEPKFKQGRLEMKSSRSRFILEESDQPIDGDSSSDVDSNKIIEDSTESSMSASKRNGLSSKSITFSLHFCDPKIHTIHHAKSIDRQYRMPENILTHIVESQGQECLNSVTESQIELVFDTRRMNLDRDRPLIDHILTAVRYNAPNYLDLIYAPRDSSSKREVLISCPKNTKLLRGSIKRELGPGIFEIHSEPLAETGEIIKIIHPYESSYAVLPLNWANNHEDCLSINPSRNPSPIVPADTNDVISDKSIRQDQKENHVHELETTGDSRTTPTLGEPINNLPTIDEDNPTGLHHDANEQDEQCLKESRSRCSRVGGFFREVEFISMSKNDFDEFGQVENFRPDNPASWLQVLRNKELNAPKFHCCIDYSQKKSVESRFKVMDLLEVVHPSSDSTICLGRIRKVVFPLIWIQISIDCYTVVPFNSTNLYPTKWCETHNHKLISLLPPRKRCSSKTPPQQGGDSKRRKKVKLSDDKNIADFKDGEMNATNSEEFYEKEHFDLGSLNDRQAGIDYILNEKSAYIKIFFNHKCFTGPSLSKSKICSLPQYVGPGPMRLVIEEVVTKVISVAYVPPRILNDLSSKSFEELLIERGLTNTIAVEFKAKYQKRVHRDTIPVCVNPDDVALYCECICEHIKCCYNLFGLALFDGDDCPSHCRSLTKSNKFMKRATYYREKARQGEFLNQNDNSNGKKTSNTAASENPGQGATSRAKYAGRGSSESTSSGNLSSSDHGNNRASPSSGRAVICEMKENSISPDAWTIDDVARYLDVSQLGIFKSYMLSEGIDGQALLLLDKATIEEHFQQQLKTDITQEETSLTQSTVPVHVENQTSASGEPRG